MNKITIGLIGYGNVGAGVVKLLQKKRSYIKEAFNTEINLKIICDRSIEKKNPPKDLGKIIFTADPQKIIQDPEIDVVVELIGGMNPAKDIVIDAIKNGKHVVTANKELIANHGKELFQIAVEANKNIYFESSCMAGVPSIKMITEGMAGNQFNALYGIINGTCNYILTIMTKKDCSFGQAVEEAQQMGYAEKDPTLDINGMDSAHKLGILIALTLGKWIKVKEIHAEGITHISHDDIEYAESLGLSIKLLAIAKKIDNEIEARVHPTLISQEHPLASLNGVLNGVFMESDPLGSVLLSGKGAGQLTAAAGVLSDLINIACRKGMLAANMMANMIHDSDELKVREIDQISTKFYIRFMAADKPGTLAQIAGILAEHDISINSVTQKAHNKVTAVPVIMLTDYAKESQVRQALDKIYKLGIVKSKPVVIRMENLK
jgi:homoserine dehydrogenase